MSLNSEEEAAGAPPAPPPVQTEDPINGSPFYDDIAAALKSGDVVPFLGAGVHMGNRNVGDTFAPGCGFVPNGSELAALLRTRARFPVQRNNPCDAQDLAKVASYFTARAGRELLRERLHECFDCVHTPRPKRDIHRYLAQLAKRCTVKPVIITTNYDDALEQAFDAEGQPYEIVVYPTDRPDLEGSVFRWKHGAAEPEELEVNEAPIEPRDTTVIFKMHGTIRRPSAVPPPPGRAGRKHPWDSYVISEEDYAEFLSRMANHKAIPKQLIAHCQYKHFLFLGYGLRDWNLRAMLSELRPEMKPDEANLLGMRPSWAIQYPVWQLDRVLWEKRNVTIYELDIGYFIEQLTAAG